MILPVRGALQPLQVHTHDLMTSIFDIGS